MADEPSDVHSIRTVLEQLEQFSRARTALPILQPLLSRFGVNTDAIETSLQSLEGIRVEAVALAQTLDRFNEFFASRGWIAYDMLDIKVAKGAVAAAESGDLAEAEELLTQHYSADRVAFLLRTLMGLAAFRPRMRLAELALHDYREQRYHACIPVVLALLDGMVQEVENQGFFSKNVDLTAWDSIAAYDRGLNELQKLLFRQRGTTTTDEITLPYRNGILHGMDLAYDTQLVAAKCWAALFATADWARRNERGKKDAPPPEPDLSWRDLLDSLRRNQEKKQALEAWKPRQGVDIANPVEGSPEAALAEFLSAWKSRNYGLMAKRLDPYDRRPLNTRAGKAREYYKHSELHAFSIGCCRRCCCGLGNICSRSGDQFWPTL